MPAVIGAKKLPDKAMKFSNRRLSASPATRFNLTPLIDVCFLLIIFFVLVCQYIVSENFAVAVPDKCGFAQSNQTQIRDTITVTIMQTGTPQKVCYAVGSEKITAQDGESIANEITRAIDARLKDRGGNEKIVSLRADKTISFRQSQCALAGIAKSSAAGVRLAVCKDKQEAAE